MNRDPVSAIRDERSAGEADQSTQARSHSNNFVAFLRHYGPIPASDNMYDELIQTESVRHKVDPPIRIKPARLKELMANFRGEEPDNVILTGTAGDGKSYHCRRVWEEFGGDVRLWQRGQKIARLDLPHNGKRLVIVKDLSELSARDKAALFPDFAASVAGREGKMRYLVAANDGQLIASWRDWAEVQGGQSFADFKVLEEMLVEERSRDPRLWLRLYNLSRLETLRLGRLPDSAELDPDTSEKVTNRLGSIREAVRLAQTASKRSLASLQDVPGRPKRHR